MQRRSATIAAWCLYDWAITPFSTIVITFIVSSYFSKAIAPDQITGSAEWSFMIALSSIGIGILSPPLGAIADRMGHAKRGLAIATIAVAIVAALLWFARPDPALSLPVLVLVGAGVVAFQLGILFCNALLPSVAPYAQLGRVSGWGWAMGYAGGLGCLVIALLFLVQPAQPAFGIARTAAANIRACGPLAALWLAAFGWPLFLLVPDTVGTGGSVQRTVRQSLVELGRTIVGLRAQPQLLRFMIASAIYLDGITTILAIGALYAGGTFGMDLNEVIVFGIGLNVTAGLGAAGFAWLDDWLGSKRTIVLALAGLIGFGAAIIAVHDKNLFFGLALALGIFIGPAQSASRSMIVRLAPREQVGQCFGLYAMTGRAVSFVGPAMFGLVTALTRSQRAGLSVIVLLLVVGLAVLVGVREPKAGRSA